MMGPRRNQDKVGIISEQLPWATPCTSLHNQFLTWFLNSHCEVGAISCFTNEETKEA